jgi:uncharacterized glyoxalase superfamily protein PhnB
MSGESVEARAKTRFRSAAPTFLVDDVGKTARWYQTNLGFTVSTHPKHEPYVFASLNRDGVELMLLRMPGYQKAQISREGGSWDAYIRMDGVEEFYEEVRQRVAVRMELTKQPYGNTEFEVRDPNGYVIVFSS